MAPRQSTRPARENDFSNVGKVGRRTGVTLPQGRLDVNGMEEITGIFSSPRKPSPLRKSTSVVESVEVASTTPLPTRSTRKSMPLPRSASPRKSGISGTAKRGKVVDVLGQNKESEKEKENENEKATERNDTKDIESRPTLTPSLLTAKARRFSPNKSPQGSSSASKTRSVRATRKSLNPVDDRIHDSIELVDDSSIIPEVIVTEEPPAPAPVEEEDYVLPAVNDDEEVDRMPNAGMEEDNVDDPPLPPPFDDEEADETFEPEARSKTKSREPTIANSRKKRKSDAQDEEVEVEAISSPAAKRAKRISDQGAKGKQVPKPAKIDATGPIVAKSKERQPLKAKSTNLKMSAAQTDQLNKIINKVKARPGQKKSLYVLRRETPAEDGVTHTRSGRVSVKPLAYWRNERCVYGGSPGVVNLQDGARFPLNSIKEIIRTQEIQSIIPSKKMKSSKSARRKIKSADESNNLEPQEERQETIDQEEEDSDQELNEEYVDPDAEPWEVEKGIFRGSVAMWDEKAQQAIDDEDEEMEIAYAPASIETREVKGSTFRYAKLLSSKFFGSGIVDLPAGGVKKAKNSRRMHMSFFVASGRVTVQVNALNGPENRFSIGKGGWWQVPRGNQYAIENEHQKPARVFFSQACEPLPVGEYD